MGTDAEALQGRAARPLDDPTYFVDWALDDAATPRPAETPLVSPSFDTCPACRGGELLVVLADDAHDRLQCRRCGQQWHRVDGRFEIAEDLPAEPDF